MVGWVKLHRKLIEWEWYSDQNAKSLFIHCLLKANVKDKTWRGIKIKKGQFFTSIAHLSHELDLSVKQIRTAMTKLESTGEITSEGASNGTKITVCNYGNYQSNGNTQGQAMGQTKGKRRASEGQQHKKDNNIKEREEIFKNELSKFILVFGQSMIDDFYNYWTEPNKSKTKMRFELERTWDLSRRLATWERRSNNIQSSKSTGVVGV